MVIDDYFSEVFNVSPVPTVLVQVDSPQFTIIDANSAFAALCGKPRGDLLQQSFLNGFSDLVTGDEAAIRESLEKTIRKKAAAKTRLQEMAAHTESRCFELVSTPILNKNQTIKYILCTLQNADCSESHTVSHTKFTRITDLEHLERIVLELNSQNNVSKTVLTRYIEGLERIFPGMQCSVLKVNNGYINNWASVSLPKAFENSIDNIPIGEHAGSCGTAAFLKKQVIVSDIATDIRWAQCKHLALQHNLLACWSTPVINAQGEVMATLAMYYQTVRKPDEDELKAIDRTAAILKIILENRQNSELLKETSFLMKQGQELAHFGNWAWDIKTNEVTWSDELFEIYGVDRNTFKATYEGYLELLHADDRQRVSGYITKILKDHRDVGFEERIVRPDGSIRHLKSWGRLLLDEHGKPAKMIGACLDITESKKIQEKLLASETRLRNLVDAQTNYVIRMDLTGNYTYANKKYIADFSRFFNKEDFTGVNALLTILPHHHQRVIETVNNCVANPNTVYEVELDKIKDDGIRATLWHFIGLTTPDGKPSEIQCIGLDISDKKEAENERAKKVLELAESEKRYSDLFHSSPQPMWVYDLDTYMFLDVNTAAIKQYGYSREEFLSMDVLAIRPPEERQKMLDAIGLSKKQQSGIFYHGVYVHRKKSGELIHVDIQTNPLPYKGRNASVVLATNITERLNYIRAIEKQNARLQEIGWIQSHVVRAPLARIMGLIDILKNCRGTDINQDELLQHILVSALEMDTIIKDIVSRAEQIELYTSDEQA
ncbi:PAS domain S-box protein [Pedobacter sp. BS3]|uniref:PAS domain S-box protein n=1 Tax=Pedobacter sp. BS3 TaxID=2567937 RepID=UPI0011EDE0EA|nr:PAS domain S-box protein [Pedobacter sp. BS3]TZF84572.1 PAS domain S-box protein [Pedobacter sp. BS3]